MCLCGSNTLPYVCRELSKYHASLSTNGDGLRIWKHGPGKGFDHHKASDPSHLMPFTPHTVLFYKPSKRGQQPQQPQQQQQSPEIPWYMQRREYNVDELPSVPPVNRHMEQQRDSASLPSTPQQQQPQQQLNSANINYA